MPDAPICPVMSRPVYFNHPTHGPMPDIYEQVCVGSRCAAWIAQSEHNKRGDLEPTGVGRCGMTLHATFNFPDPAKQPPDFPLDPLDAVARPAVRPLTKNARQLTEPAGAPIGGTTMNVASTIVPHSA